MDQSPRIDRIVCVTTIPNDPWLGKLIEDKGDVLIVESDDGTQKEVSITDCEILDKEIQP